MVKVSFQLSSWIWGIKYFNSSQIYRPGWDAYVTFATIPKSLADAAVFFLRIHFYVNCGHKNRFSANYRDKN